MGKKKGKGQGPAPRSGSNSLSESVNTASPAASTAGVNVTPATATTTSPAMPIPISAAADKKSSPMAGTPPALPKSPLTAAPPAVTQLASSPLSVTSPPIAVPMQPAAAKPNNQGPKPSPPINKPSSPMTKTAPISFPSMPQAPTASTQLGTSPSRNMPAMQKGRSDFSSQTSHVLIPLPGDNAGLINNPIVGSPAKNAGNINASIVGSPGKGAGILNNPIVGSPGKNTGIINPVVGSPGKNAGQAPVKLSDIGITPISPKSPGSPKVDMKFMNPLQRIPDESKKDFSKVEQKSKDQEKVPTQGEKPVDEKKLSPKNTKGQQKTSPKVERKAQTPDKKPADIPAADIAQNLPFTSAIKQELKLQEPLKSVPLLTDFSSFLSSTAPSLPAQGKESGKITQENKPFLPPIIPPQVEKQQAAEKKSTEIKNSPISQPPLSLESLLGNISAKDLTKDTLPKQSPIQQLPVAEIKGVAKDIKNVIEPKQHQQPKAPEKPLNPVEKPAPQQQQLKKEPVAALVKDIIEEPKKVAVVNAPKTEENIAKAKAGSPAPTSPAVDEANKAKDNKQQQKPEIPKKPAGLKPSKQQMKPEAAVQKPKTDEPEQKNIPQKNQAQDDKLNKPSVPEKEQSTPKVEKLQLVPEVLAPLSAKNTGMSPVKEQAPAQASSPVTKQSTPPNKNENTDKLKPEAPKKEENTTKGKDAKKGKNAQKSSADDFLKERKVSSSENAEPKGKNEKDSTKLPQNDSASNKNEPKQDKAVPKEVAPAPVAPEKASQKTEEKRAPEGRKISESQGKQAQSVKVEAKPAEKKDEKQEKNEPKKKAEETKPLDKVVPKDQKAEQAKAPEVQQKQSPTQEKGNKKDKNPPKDVKVQLQKDEKVTAKEEIVTVPKEEKGQQQKAAKEEKPPAKDNKEKPTPKSNESEKPKKEQQKGNKAQEPKPLQTENAGTTAESTAIKDDKKSQNKQQQQKKPVSQDEAKPQGKQGPKEKKVVDKVQAKDVEPKSEGKISTESDKNAKDKADSKKAEKPAQQPAKPKADKPKADNKPKPSDVKNQQTTSAPKVEASLSDDEDLEPKAGDSAEVTAAKKKRRRRKKNKKPAGTEGTTNDVSSDKPKPPENKSQKKAKDNQQTPNKPQENQQGTKPEKPTQPKQEKVAQPKPEKPAVSTEQSKPSPAPSSAPVEAKQGDNEGQSQDAQAKKKKNKNKKKKQGPGGTEDSTEGQNDSAGQKKTPFEFQLPKLTLNPLAHHLSNCCCICKTTSGNNNSPLQTCTACSLACYCCREHQKQHWPEHKDFCMYISSILTKERPYFFTPAENLSQDERRHFRLSELQLCQKALNRNPTPLESALILHPRACFTCYKPAFQKACPNCYSVNFCCQEHFPQSHLEWCSTLRIKLLFVQSQNLFGSSGVSVPHPTKVLYPFNSNMKEYLENLDLKPLNKMPKELYLAHVSELATYPLTLLHALQLLSTQGATNPLDYEHLVVHVVGAEDVFECCQILKWKYFFVNLLPKLKTLHLVFIGCELTIEDEHVHVEGRLVYEFHAKMTYLDYCRKCYIKPSIVCAFNSGLYRNTGFQGTDSWGPSLCPMLKINSGAPVLFTAYTHMESQLDLQRVKEIFVNSLQIVQLPLKNPFASIFPNHNLVSESECPVAFRNYYLTIVRHA